MQPDVFVVPEELIPARYTTGWGHVRWLLLAVEILSPATERVDRRVKRDFYLAGGVHEYWIVDLDARVIERWVPDRPTPAVRSLASGAAPAPEQCARAGAKVDRDQAVGAAAINPSGTFGQAARGTESSPATHASKVVESRHPAISPTNVASFARDGMW